MSGVEHTGSPNTCTLGEREVEAAVKSIVRRFATATHLYASRVTQRRSAMADARSVPLPKSCAACLGLKSPLFFRCGSFSLSFSRLRYCPHATFIAENLRPRIIWNSREYEIKQKLLWMLNCDIVNVRFYGFLWPMTWLVGQKQSWNRTIRYFFFFFPFFEKRKKKLSWICRICSYHEYACVISSYIFILH